MQKLKMFSQLIKKNITKPAGRIFIPSQYFQYDEYNQKLPSYAKASILLLFRSVGIKDWPIFRFVATPQGLEIYPKWFNQTKFGHANP